MVERKTARSDAGFRVHPDTILPQPARRQFPAAEPEEPEELETITVNQGHTIHVPIPERRTVAGTDPVSGEPVYRTPCKVFGPGETLELPRREAAQLRVSGHAFDPDKIAPTNTVVGDVTAQVH